MPEMIEIEAYRRLADRVVGRTIAKVQATDSWFIKDDNTQASFTRALKGKRITGTRRIGKLLLVDTDGPVVGMRFGMTGKLVVDGIEGVEELIYGSRRRDPAWDRFGLTFTDGTRLSINDARRLGGVTLNPDESVLGPDALAVTVPQLRLILQSDAPVKARLMDQAKLAGVGNLIADETLWRSGIDPRRSAKSLDANEQKRLHKHMLKTVQELDVRGGSHTGDVIQHRIAGGRCPKDGAEMTR
ncbi:MAG: DNA-formamidopyrimidine glycosylase family protein, partial [Acidimicrobiales bacterium]|nr:DNA-formamidopyrimidine glycosylase family protein [Acidimicrobiales bacterium]